jgi:hypothetical protein
MFRFIFYVILFYLIVKALNAFFRWLRMPKTSGNAAAGGGRNSSNPVNPQYKDIEEAEFTEIETQTKKEKAQE